MALVQEAEKLIEAVPMGVMVRRAALVPFADQSGRVSGALQGFGDCDFLHRQAEARSFIERSGGIELITEACRNSPGEQARPGRAAIGTGDIAGGEPNAVRRDRVDMRRWNLGIPLTAELPITEVIREEDNDVGALDSGGANGHRGCQQEGK